MTSISVSVNGECKVPPGFRFQPTEEELLLYYLTKRVSCKKINLDIICDIDLNKFEPWDIQEKCKIGSMPQNDCYFFSHKDKKYTSGTRTNRATIAGFWKATGRDKVIYSNGRRIGMRKTLVFYNGRAPHGERSDWVMHEYRLHIELEETNFDKNIVSSAMGGEATEEEGWVVCHIFIKKKRRMKALNNPSNSSPNNYPICNQLKIGAPDPDSLHQISGLTGWAAFDRLIASQLDGHTSSPIPTLESL